MSDNLSKKEWSRLAKLSLVSDTLAILKNMGSDSRVILAYLYRILHVLQNSETDTDTKVQLGLLVTKLKNRLKLNNNR